MFAGRAGELLPPMSGLRSGDTRRSTKVNDNFHGIIKALKQTADRLIQEIRRRLFGSGGTEDPFAAVRVPRPRNPPGRAGAIALEEPQGEVRVEAVGRRPG